MTSVRILPRAEIQIRDALEWWLHNRQVSPDLMEIELGLAIGRLGDLPKSGLPYRNNVYRLLLPRVRYHLYYTFHPNENTVLIRAF